MIGHPAHGSACVLRLVSDRMCSGAPCDALHVTIKGYSDEAHAVNTAHGLPTCGTRICRSFTAYVGSIARNESYVTVRWPALTGAAW